MNRQEVKQRIQQYSAAELKEWRVHAVKCLQYFTKYRNDFEIEECEFVIHHIDQRLKTLSEAMNRQLKNCL